LRISLGLRAKAVFIPFWRYAPEDCSPKGGLIP
jgi:hypothetical protein